MSNDQSQRAAEIAKSVATDARTAQKAYQIRGDREKAQTWGETVDRALDRLNELNNAN